MYVCKVGNTEGLSSYSQQLFTRFYPEPDVFISHPQPCLFFRTFLTHLIYYICLHQHNILPSNNEFNLAGFFLAAALYRLSSSVCLIRTSVGTPAIMTEDFVDFHRTSWPHASIYGGPLVRVLRISGWSGQFKDNCSAVFPIEVIVIL
jgi:hypothetical protein